MDLFTCIYTIHQLHYNTSNAVSFLVLLWMLTIWILYIAILDWNLRLSSSFTRTVSASRMVGSGNVSLPSARKSAMVKARSAITKCRSRMLFACKQFKTAMMLSYYLSCAYHNGRICEIQKNNIRDKRTLAWTASCGSKGNWLLSWPRRSHEVRNRWNAVWCRSAAHWNRIDGPWCRWSCEHREIVSGFQAKPISSWFWNYEHFACALFICVFLTRHSCNTTTYQSFLNWCWFFLNI